MRRRPKRPGRCHLAARSPARPCCWRPPFPAARCCARSWPRPRSRTEPPTPARGGAPQALQACRSPAHARRSLLKHLKPATASSLGPANCALCLAARPLARPRPPRTMVVNPLHAAAASAKSPLNHYMQPCNYSKIFPNRLRRSPKNAANYAVGRLGPPNLPRSLRAHRAAASSFHLRPCMRPPRRYTFRKGSSKLRPLETKAHQTAFAFLPQQPSPYRRH